MGEHPTVSVIIPTYNRKESLRQTLASLACQSWASDRFEVIVVDDGSTDGTEDIAGETFPFKLRYLRQTNQGDALARNTGAQHSQADILVFLDDDILASEHYLQYLIREHEPPSRRIVVGAEILCPADSNPLTTSSHALPDNNRGAGTEEIPFAEVRSNNMSVRRDAYFSVGMMHDLGFRGSSIWCDVDFSYRAYRQGFEFLRRAEAICWHRDYVAQSLDSQKRRMRETAYRAVVLFQKYPELIAHLPMFQDKRPIAWADDEPGLIIRKLTRPLASSPPALWSIEQLAHLLEQRQLWPHLQHVLARWIVGGYIYQGYQAGLRAHQQGNGQHVSP